MAAHGKLRAGRPGAQVLHLPHVRRIHSAADAHVQDMRHTDGQEDPRRAADLLRQVQRGAIVYQDPEYLLPHNHISQEKGAPGAWRKALSNEEASAIGEQNADWLKAADYPV